MSDTVQTPLSIPATQWVAPVRSAEPQIEPAKKSQSDNRNANDNKGGDSQAGQQAERHLSITRNPAVRAFIYKSIDADSGDVVWQWPNEQAVRRAQHLRDVEEQIRHEVDEKA